MVTDELRAFVRVALETVAPEQQVIEADWDHFALACGVDENAMAKSPSGDGGAVVVGADVVSLVRSCDQVIGELVILTPSLMRRSRWQPGARSQSFGASQKLWRAGWSPVCVDRVRIPVPDGELEMLVAVARQTPPVRVHEQGRR